MPLRHVARILFCSALASLAGAYVGVLLAGWLAVLPQSVDWSEALASLVYMPFAAFVGTALILPRSFPTACALALFCGGCLWQFGRRRAWARNRAPWLAAGGLCGLVEALRLVEGVPSLFRETWLVLCLPAAAAGAAAALIFRAAMPILPPYCDSGEDGGWEP
ncbi:MAG: hypothetical protein QOJ94_2943 [Sphingomonadales bacterium]|jgi:hypothetical protein|nr:hypothetical protein [Sphingomonadales bacterium]